MKIMVTLIPSNIQKTVELQSGSTVSDLLEKLCLKPDTVIVTKDDIPIPIDDVVTGIQALKILQVASGG